MAWGYARAADALGVDIIQDCEVTGIRRDEDPTRAKERYFSPRNKDFEWDTAKAASNLKRHKVSFFEAATAFADILAKVNSVTNQLPQGSQLPVITKTTGSSIALLYVNYASKKLNPQQIYDYLSRVVQPKLQSVAAPFDVYAGAILNR